MRPLLFFLLARIVLGACRGREELFRDGGLISTPHMGTFNVMDQTPLPTLLTLLITAFNFVIGETTPNQSSIRQVLGGEILLRSCKFWWVSSSHNVDKETACPISPPNVSGE
ncbi:MAG: hypothetical protein CM15mP84_02710 [Cellvibrionales bacterium]|nr:MAG: hypothetical protein CM15mP84_02710 [Cellvibrionales bacterium]